jgi:hypothetical protein
LIYAVQNNTLLEFLTGVTGHPGAEGKKLKKDLTGPDEIWYLERAKKGRPDLPI